LLIVGSLFPTSVRVQEDKRLVVTFKSEPHFHGQFVPSNPGMLFEFSVLEI